MNHIYKPLFSDEISELDIHKFLPELQPYLILSENAYSPDNLSTEGILEIRRLFSANLPGAPDIVISERFVKARDGHEIPVKVFVPVEYAKSMRSVQATESTGSGASVQTMRSADLSAGTLPVVLYLHGGGYMVGCDAQCYEQMFSYCRTLPCISVMPEFRLAPENPYPAGVEDCYSVLEDLWNNPDQYGIDRNRIAITGFSCGGAMTIALCLMSRDRNGPKIRFQMPVSPTMNDRLDTPSALSITDPRILNLHFLKRVWNYYLGEGHENRDIPAYAAPSRTRDYSGLPPCFLHIAQYDPHYDEAMTYVRTLAECGVPVSWKEYRGCFHAFEISASKTRIGKEANRLLTAKLREGLAD